MPDLPEFTDEEIEESYKLPADGQLQFLVDWVNGTDMEMGITVMAGGLMVSGKLASSHRYFEAFADRVAGGLTFVEFAPDADIEGLRGQVRDLFALPGIAAKDAPRGRQPAPRHIHIRDARFRLGAVVVNPLHELGERPWWRGRLAQIDGFMLGEIDNE